MKGAVDREGLTQRLPAFCSTSNSKPNSLNDVDNASFNVDNAASFTSSYIEPLKRCRCSHSLKISKSNVYD